MFYYLQYFKDIHPSMSWLRVFDQVTFRTAMAAITAILISLLFGRRMINLLKKLNFGQYIREEGPQTHHSKKGTPTMGGVLIMLSITVSTLLWSNLSVAYVWIVVLTTLAYAAIGFADDY